MKFPSLKPISQTRVPLALGGIFSPERAREGGFLHAENLITEDGCTVTHPPRLALSAPTCGRGICRAYIDGQEVLCYVANEDLVVGDRHYPLGLRDTAHRLIPYGNKIFIFPERKYLCPEDGASGELDATLSTASSTLFTLCRADGSPYAPMATAVTAPESPTHGDFWLDTALKPAVLRCFSEVRQEWQTVTDTYLRLNCPGIGIPFRAGDTITLTGIVPTELRALNGAQRLVACGEDHLVIAAAPCVTLRQQGSLTVARRMPEMDTHTLLLLDGILYGAFQGKAEDGTYITRIYSSRLRDIFCQADDSHFDEESDGAQQREVTLSEPITAAICYDGLPYFFTEHGWLSPVGQGKNMRFVLKLADGVRIGCGESLCEIDGALYYLSPRGMMRYDGRQATEISSPPQLANVRMAAAGGWGRRYYLSVTEDSGKSHLLIYDTVGGLWSRKDGTRACDFLICGTRFCYRDGCDGAIYSWDVDADIDDGKWMALSAPILSQHKGEGRFCRMELSLRGEVGGEVQVLVGYNGAPPREVLAEALLTDNLPITLMLHPRCAPWITLQIQGRGTIRLEGLTKVLR